MISQALGRLRVRTTAAEQLEDLLSEPGTSPPRSSTNPLNISTSSPVDNVTIIASPTYAPKITKREQKRYGNNLFGSGNLRDDIHPRIARGIGRSTSPNAGSDTSTIPRTLRTKFKFLRPGSPEADSSGISTSTPSPNVLTDHESFSTSQTAFLDSSPGASTETWLSHMFQPNAPKHVSLALEEVIRGIEEETQEARIDDDIVFLRSPVVDQRQVTVNNGNYLVSYDQ